eukprot:scaffold5763_cov249-Pinguiococcus_pyrenoidosus.AAC.1
MHVSRRLPVLLAREGDPLVGIVNRILGDHVYDPVVLVAGLPEGAQPRRHVVEEVSDLDLRADVACAGLGRAGSSWLQGDWHSVGIPGLVGAFAVFPARGDGDMRHVRDARQCLASEAEGPNGLDSKRSERRLSSVVSLRSGRNSCRKFGGPSNRRLSSAWTS